MRKHEICAAVAALTVAAAGGGETAHGAISILKADGSPAAQGEAAATLNFITGAWDIILASLYAPGGDTVYEIHGNGGERIGDVLIDVPCWEGPDGECVPAGSPVTVSIFSDPPGGIDSIGSVVQTGNAETFLLDVHANEDIGHVEARVIGTVVAGRDVIGPVVSTTPDHPDRGVFWVEAARDILGDVLAPNGRIGRIWAHRNIGTADAPVQLVAKHKINGIFAAEPACIASWLAGETITCAGEVHADVETHANGGTGNIFRFLAGTYDGTFATNALRPDTATGTPGTMAVTESFDGRIVMGRTFDVAGQSIDLPASGFSGQIILNADALPGLTWNQPVHLGAADDPGRITLVGPTYPQSAAALGGGSIGLVPFALHASSCSPPANALIVPPTGEQTTLVLRHYGPVAITGPAPLVIGRRPVGTAGPFTPAPLSLFEIISDPDDPNSIVVTSAPGQHGFEEGFEYEVSAGADLRSDVPGQPAVGWTAAYRISIQEPGCPADFDGNGDVNMVDLLILLAFWGTPGSVAGDLDGDGLVSFADIIRLLAAWGTC